MKTSTLELSVIRCDSGTQSRLNINEDVVSNYAERMSAGDEFPPMDVFFDGSEYHLADGFHRMMAANRNGVKTFECVIHKGTSADALWFALGANRRNGCHMTPADKRNAISLALAKFPEKTQQAIAEHVGCSQGYVAKVQAELIPRNKLNVPAKRTGKDGKDRPTKYADREEPAKVKPEEQAEQQKPATQEPSQNLFPRSESGVKSRLEPEKPPMEDYSDQGQKRDLDLASVKSNLEAVVTNVIHYAPKGELAGFKLFLEREASRVGMANRQHRAEMASQEKES